MMTVYYNPLAQYAGPRITIVFKVKYFLKLRTEILSLKKWTFEITEIKIISYFL